MFLKCFASLYINGIKVSWTYDLINENCNLVLIVFCGLISGTLTAVESFLKISSGPEVAWTTTAAALHDGICSLIHYVQPF